MEDCRQAMEFDMDDFAIDSHEMSLGLSIWMDTFIFCREWFD